MTGTSYVYNSPTEQGAIGQNNGDSDSLRIVLVCSDTAPVDPVDPVDPPAPAAAAAAAPAAAVPAAPTFTG